MSGEKQPDLNEETIKPLSLELQTLLEEEAEETEIRGAMDAAAEEGHPITRDEAIQILINQGMHQPQEKSA